MKCPECVKEGKRSTIQIGASFTTLMCIHRWYDEDGNLHVDDPNKPTTGYTCSNGHKWSETT